MNAKMRTQIEHRASSVIFWWQARSATILHRSVIGMGCIATVWLSYQFWRLLFQTTPMGAIDLLLRHTSIHGWFAGAPVYPAYSFASYPPASFVLLWPFTGWLGEVAARWLWAVTTIACIVWLIQIILRESAAKNAVERRFVAMIPLAMYATGAAIGNGQLINHIVPCLIASLLILREERVRWRGDRFGSALFICALVKPSVTAPFFGIALLALGRVRPAVLIVGGYSLVTLFAMQFQPDSPVDLIVQWQTSAQESMYTGPVFNNSFGNLHSTFHALGIDEWLSTASVGLLSILTGWIALNRRGDLWGLMGACAIVSLLASYHGWYDDLLILIPMIALYRVAGNVAASATLRVSGGVLMGATLLSTLAPGGAHLFPSPWREIYIAWQVGVWLCALAFLMCHVTATHRQSS